MANNVAFTVPQGVRFEATANGIRVQHDGDVVIQNSLGSHIERIDATGDVSLAVPVEVGVITAGGTVSVHDGLKATSVHAAAVQLLAGEVEARSITADREIRIGPAKLTVDAVVAPHIELDAETHGRVTVIESANERGPSNVKGGFSLRDYDDMIGNAAGFLEERGIPVPDYQRASPAELAPTEEPTPASAVPPAFPTAPAEAATPEPADDLEEIDDIQDIEDFDDLEALVELTPQGGVDDEDEEIDDPLSLSVDDLEPLEADEVNGVQSRLNDAVRRITACYDAPDMPPAVVELRSLVEDGNMDALSQNIGSVWNGLLSFHQKRGIRPHHQVTHAFNVIHSLVS